MGMIIDTKGAISELETLRSRRSSRKRPPIRAPWREIKPTANENLRMSKARTTGTPPLQEGKTPGMVLKETPIVKIGPQTPS
jgi:hypothetical protein